MRKLFAYLALLVCVLTAPLAARAATVWTFYVDVAARGWTTVTCHRHYSNNGGGWTSPSACTLVSGTIYKVSFTDFDDLDQICFSGTTSYTSWYDPSSIPSNYKNGNFTLNNTSTSWQMVNNALYTLNTSGGATITYNYDPTAASGAITGYYLVNQAGTSTRLTANGTVSGFYIAAQGVNSNTSRYRVKVTYETGETYYAWSSDVNNANAWLNSGTTSIGLGKVTSTDTSNNGWWVFQGLSTTTSYYVTLTVDSDGIPTNVELSTTAPGPSFSYSSAGGTYSSSTGTMDVTITASGLGTSDTQWWYSLDGGTTKTYVSKGSDATVTIGTASTSSSVTITCGVGTTTYDTQTYNITYKDPSATHYIYWDNSSSNWSAVCIYLHTNYTGTANTGVNSWPGEAMTYDSTLGLWKWEISNTADYVMFNNNNNGSQYPSGGGFDFVEDYVYGPDGKVCSISDYADRNKISYIELWYTSNSGTRKAQIQSTDANGNFVWCGTVRTASDSEWDSRYYLKAFNSADTELGVYTVGGSSATYYLSPDTEATLVTRTGDYNFCFNANNSTTAADETVTMTVYSSGTALTKMIYTKGDTSSGDWLNTTAYTLNVRPRAVKESGSWSAWSADEPVIYIIGDDLNSNRIVPDWEMERQEDGSYVLSGVALRGTGSADGTTYSGTLKAVKFTKGTGDGYSDATCQVLSFTPPTLESGTKQYGYEYNLSLASADAAMECTLVSKLPPYIGIVGEEFGQVTTEDTPNYYGYITGVGDWYAQGSTSVGWQESYILYDSDGNIERDLNGKCIYSTQWPPKNNIFMAITKDGETVEVSADNLTFTRQDSDGAPLVQKGSEWKAQLYGTDSDVINADYKNLTLDADTYFTRYVINNVWILGKFKVWTGWGSSKCSWGAQWDLHKNWGTGDAFAAEATLHAADNGGDYNADAATYYKTVEFFIPTNTSTMLAANDWGKLYTTLALGNVSIQAKATKINGADNNNTGAYKPTLTLDGYTLVGYEIKRYDANSSDMASTDPADWTLAGTRASSSDYVVTSVGSADSDVQVFLTSDYVDETKELANGRYFYSLTIWVKNDDGTVRKTETVISNPFTIANYAGYEAEVEPIQLVYIKSDIATANPTYAAYAGKFLTYRPGRNGDYYVLTYDADTETLTSGSKLSASTASALCTYLAAHPEVFTWTARYYVRAFDANEFNNTMSTAKAAGTITDYAAPTVYARNSADTEWKTLGSYSNVYGYVYNAGGSLKSQTFEARAQYTYTPSGEAAVTYPASFDGYVAPTATIAPTAPAPYLFSASYSEDAEATTPSWLGDVTLADDTNADPDDEIKVGEYLPVRVASSLLRGSHNLKFRKDHGIKTRTFDAVFSFMQPNVEDNIVKYYDIAYSVVGTNNYTWSTDKQDIVGSDTDVNYWYSPATYTDVNSGSSAVKRTEPYTFQFNCTHPSDDIHPIFIIRDVTYTPHASGGDEAQLEALYPYEDMVIEAPSEIVYSDTPTVSNLQLKHVANERGLWNWIYAGHVDFKDPGEEIGTPDDPEATLTPAYYLIETAIKGQGASTGWPVPATETTNYYNVPYLVLHDGSTYNCMGGANTSKPDDPFIGQVIGIDYPVGSTITFAVTPVYVFERHPEAEMKTSDFLRSTSTVNGKRARVTLLDDANLPQIEVVNGTPMILDSDASNVTTGIESVGYDAYDASAEYYNLQGIRVQQPQPGQIYVVRRGTCVTKEYVK